MALTKVTYAMIEDAPVNVRDFGAVCDGVTDDTNAVIAAIKSVCNYENSYTNATACRAAFQNVVPKIVFIDGLCRVTQTIYVPAGVTLQSGRSYFNRVVETGIYYDPVNLNTAAVSMLNYKKQLDSSYSLNADITTLPTGGEFDSGDYITAANNAQLECTIITSPGVQLGVSFIGAAGCVTTGLCIGENTSGTASNARMPKVGLLQVAAWGTIHNSLRILARVQGVVLANSNGGATFNQPYIARNGTVDNSTETPVYIAGYAKGGAMGVTCLSTNDITINEPIVEHWWTAFVFNATSGPLIVNPHIEGTNGLVLHAFAVVDSDIVVDNYKSVAIEAPSDDPNASLFWIQDCASDNMVIARGLAPVLGYRFVTGSSSSAVLRIENINRQQLQYGVLGTSAYIDSVTYIDFIKNDYPFVQLNASTGDDTNWGLVTKTVSTVGAAVERARIFGGKANIQFSSNVTMSSNVSLERISYLRLLMGAYTLTVNGGISFDLASGNNVYVIVGSGTLNGSATSAPFQFKGSGSILNLAIIGASTILSSNYSIVLFTANYTGTANITAFQSTISSISKYANASVNGYGAVTLGICTPNRNTGIDASPVNASVAVFASDFRNS